MTRDQLCEYVGQAHKKYDHFLQQSKPHRMSALALEFGLTKSQVNKLVTGRGVRSDLSERELDEIRRRVQYGRDLLASVKQHSRKEVCRRLNISANTYDALLVTYKRPENSRYGPPDTPVHRFLTRPLGAQV